MRLLDTTTFELKTFIGGEIPRYAILSHTWGSDEVLFEDLKAGKHREQLANPGRGLRKVIATCKLACEESLQYAWIDTCCIDKSSSAELSEAINSMYAWYRDSAACYAYLEDVTDEASVDEVLADIERSKWFRRGWTLQELLAPHGLIFFGKNWGVIGSRHKLASIVSAITGIKPSFLRRRHDDSPLGHVNSFVCRTCGGYDSFHTDLHHEQAASIMHWASQRQTTREEDIAYCLIGLFGVSMPLLYGEGTKAFRRLQMEILSSAPDQSILNWAVDGEHEILALVTGRQPFLAPSPACFRFALPSRLRPAIRTDLRWTQDGLAVSVLLGTAFLSDPDSEGTATIETPIAILTCAVDNDVLTRVGIFVNLDTSDQYSESGPSHVTKCVRAFRDTVVLIRHGSTPKVLASGPSSSLTKLFQLKTLGEIQPCVNVEACIRYTVPCDILFVERLPVSSFIQPKKPQLKLDIRELHDYKVDASYPSPCSGGILSLGGADYPYERPDNVNEHGETISRLSWHHEGVLLLVKNPTYGFFVFWRSRAFLETGHIVCQVQYSVQEWADVMGTPNYTTDEAEIFKSLDLSEERSSRGQWLTKGTLALADISKKLIPEDEWFTAAESGPARVCIHTVDFLDRTSYVLEIKSLYDPPEP